MTRAMSVMLTLCLAGAVWAQEPGKEPEKPQEPKAAAKQEPAKEPSAEDKELIDFLKKADAATKKAGHVRYKVELAPWGTADAQVPKLAGTVVLAGESRDGSLDRYFMEFKGTAGGGASIEGTIGSDGDEYFLLDPGSKKAHIDIDPSVSGRRAQVARFLAMIEFIHPEPFSDEIKGDSRKKLPEEKIGDVECMQIHVVYSGAQGESTWWFGKKDYLPRQVKRYMQAGGGYTTTVKDLEVDPEIDKAMFKAKVPEGWTKTDEPAP